IISVKSRMGRKSTVKEVKDEPMEVEEGGEKRNVLIMQEERVLNTYDDDSDLPRARRGGKFDVKQLCKDIKVDIVREQDERLLLEFDLLHVEAPIANALRRVLIAEVPSMAIEKVYLYQNTSVIQDEVLCHRLGLLPLNVDSREFDLPKEKIVGINEAGVDCDEVPTPDPNVHLVFAINVSCTKKAKASEAASEPHELYNDSSVYSRSFEWMPIGDQKERFAANPPRMVHEDILVAKMRPGQQIEALVHCVKGIGRDHAKFSPVATASYRLLPFITLKRPVTGDAARLFQKSFSDGVVEIKKKNGVDTAVIVDARRDTSSRNVFRHEELANSVEMGKVKDHFIFSVESTGALPAATLVIEACKVIERKSRMLRELVAASLAEFV
ncbi:hypothetical protein PFISCL1PPCAC_3584, partial [Pristionchus fissidentatus]